MTGSNPYLRGGLYAGGSTSRVTWYRTTHPATFHLYLALGTGWELCSGVFAGDISLVVRWRYFQDELEVSNA
jgi:hypothetical protein